MILMGCDFHPSWQKVCWLGGQLGRGKKRSWRTSRERRRSFTGSFRRLRGSGWSPRATASGYLADSVLVKGLAGEAFRSPDEFLNMMEKQNGKYDIQKVFVDGDDVCPLYDFAIQAVTTFFCSWYQVKDGKIASIQTVFDPRAFAAAQEKR